MFITAHQYEFKNDNNIIVLNTSTYNPNKRGILKPYKGSGLVVLIICHKDVQKNVTGWEWDQEHYDAIKIIKPVIITK